MKWTRYMNDALLAQFNLGWRDELIAEYLLIPVRLVKRRRKWHGLQPKACTEPPWADALRRRDIELGKLAKLI